MTPRGILRPRLAAALLALIAPLAATAATLEAGAPLPPLALEDQHGKAVIVGAGTRLVIFAADKAASDLINEVLAAQPDGVLTRLGAVYLADISGMPALVTRMFALPALRAMPFAVGLGRDAAQLADLPRRKGAATLLRIDAGRIAGVDYATSPERLRQALGLGSPP